MKRKNEEEKIMREMREAMAEQKRKEGVETEEPRQSAKSTSKKEEIRCPRCGHLLADRKGCPYCRYTGYIPMSKQQTKRIKYILYPILLLAAIVLFILAK